ncbi:MAG: hypothetical protein WA667_30150 [Candidatus Nitrosopolaris sp.]
MGGNASKSGMMDVLFDMRPKNLLIDEVEHLRPEYQTMLLSLMETGILTQTMHNKLRQVHLKLGYLLQVTAPRNSPSRCLADLW